MLDALYCTTAFIYNQWTVGEHSLLTSSSIIFYTYYINLFPRAENNQRKRPKQFEEKQNLNKEATLHGGKHLESKTRKELKIYAFLMVVEVLNSADGRHHLMFPYKKKFLKSVLFSFLISRVGCWTQKISKNF